MPQQGGEHSGWGIVPSALQLRLVVTSSVGISAVAVGMGAFLVFSRWSLVREIESGLIGEKLDPLCDRWVQAILCYFI